MLPIGARESDGRARGSPLSRNEEAEVQLGVADVHFLCFNSRHDAEDGAGMCGGFTFESFEGSAEPGESFFEIHWRDAQSTAIDARNTHPWFHRAVDKFFSLEVHEDAHE